MVLVYLKTDVSELRRRMKSEHQQDSVFKMTPKFFDQYVSGFENLAGEGELVVRRWWVR